MVDGETAVKKTALVVFCMLLLLLIGVFEPMLQVSIVVAQPPNSDAPNLSIIYPPHPPNRYENSSVMLEVNVRLLEGSPRPSNFSFSLDGNQLVNFENVSTSRITYWMPYVYTLYNARFNLENLSEGNHTVNVYADEMSVSRTFRVNSYYQPTVVKILSPINQTYSNGVPLVFTVNMPIKGAYYYMYRGFEAVFENHFNGNMTLDNLQDGNYVLHLYVITENGDEPASTYFYVVNNFTVSIVPYVMGITTLLAVVAIGLFVYFRRKH